jgi:hypothetical protein
LIRNIYQIHRRSIANSDICLESQFNSSSPEKKVFRQKNVNKTKNKVISPLRFWAIMDIFYKANFFSISFHRKIFHFKHPSDPNKYYTSRKNDDEQVEKKLKKKKRS